MFLSSAQSVWACLSGAVSRMDYANDEDMSVVISGGAPLTLTFTQFDTEQGFDWITVSSCTTAVCDEPVQLLYQYSGDTIPSPVTSSTGIILIQWHSDGSVAKPGWSATWTTPRSGQCARVACLRELLACV